MGERGHNTVIDMGQKEGGYWCAPFSGAEAYLQLQLEFNTTLWSVDQIAQLMTINHTAESIK